VLQLALALLLVVIEVAARGMAVRLLLVLVVMELRPLAQHLVQHWIAAAPLTTQQPSGSGRIERVAAVCRLPDHSRDPTCTLVVTIRQAVELLVVTRLLVARLF
jgi:hypothetical protein